ncbi:MAG TPA: 50S ribosomal protein L30 [Micropepsaceae bacterium]|jgi:large subunit ribosomal protein L30|nr:50S ribosomal protein L30 [Micropepsaceae bacterium]
MAGKKQASKNAAPGAKKMLTVRQIRSEARQPAKMAETLRGLGLGRIGRVKVLEDTPAVRGMIRKALHLVAVTSDE